jgi:hypothetical protein
MFPFELTQAISEKKVFFGNLNLPPEAFPDWNDLVPYFDRSFLNGNTRAKNPHKIFINVHMDDFPIVKSIKTELEKQINTNNISCHCYAGFSPNAFASPIHKDNMHVLFVMIQGSTPWKVFENGYDDVNKNGKSTFSRRLIQGDFVYVPTEVYHVAIPDSSRAGFSFGWGDRGIY